MDSVFSSRIMEPFISERLWLTTESSGARLLRGVPSVADVMKEVFLAMACSAAGLPADHTLVQSRRSPSTLHDEFLLQEVLADAVAQISLELDRVFRHGTAGAARALELLREFP